VNLLAIETSTEYLSLAAGRGDAVFTCHVEAGQRHAEMILDSISALLAQAGLRLGDLDGIAYGEGPGSFTGLRIACGVVQGLALARGLKVLGVGSLLALAEEGAADKAYACIDARMGEVYHAAYRREVNARDGDPWKVVYAPGLCGPQEVPVPEGDAWTGLGSGFAAHGEVLRRRLSGALDRVEPAVFPTATAVLRIARARFERGEGGAPEGAIPIYLRDKVALKTSER
jgi:tRNA threonylcarbamoyladenosine biosynthesis protein TsaB